MPGQRGPVPVPLQDGERDVTQLVLNTLDQKNTPVSSSDFPGVEQKDLKAALDRLASRSMVQYTQQDAQMAVLSGEGRQIVDEGSHEFKVWDAVRQAGKIDIKELASKVGDVSAKNGQGNAMKNKWIKKDGTALVASAEQVEDATRTMLQEVQRTNNLGDAKALADLKKRKLVTLGKVISYTIEKGAKFSTKMVVEVTDLTSDMLADESWKSANFKPYNFDSLGEPQAHGALHPLLKMRSELRDVFFADGFVEMPTTRFAESGFWNFDALFVPQQHPARDMQDTFYLSDPSHADAPRADATTEALMDRMEAKTDRRFDTEGPREPRDYAAYWDAVVRAHEGGGSFGTAGYRYKFSTPECLRLCLRTHTTAVSSWVLHRLAARPRPAKYFSIDRVFRNESVDATHLAEFHQVEGVIANWDFSLPDGMAFLRDFYAELGIAPLRFKPAYNPYTEPSMEVFGFHPGMKRWIEIGNSGLFRPEMLLPMGLPPNLRVFGFGLSVERPTMIKYDVRNIRDLVGHKVSLDFIEREGAVRLEKSL